MDLGVQAGSRKGRALTIAVIGSTVSLRATNAVAAGSVSDCKQGATGGIVSLFQNIGILLYVIGGVVALVAFAGAAVMFMFSGGNEGRAEKGMRWAKNTVWGLVLLAGGFFIRSVVVDFAANSHTVVAGKAMGEGADALLTNCGQIGGSK
ncbi:MAG: hypothetical protein H0W90_04100 [Actinobacteria bacterium]|nr:hypothetical protein [Actinomycetota bacterium]